MAAGKNPNISQGLSPEEYQKLLRVVRDPWAFAENIYVINPEHGRVQFNLYPFQKTVLYHFLNRKFNIVLKFRQAGLTELIAMYCLWLAMYHSNKNIVIMSLKERVAKKVLRKIKYMYKNLPDYMKVDIVNGRTGEYGTACISTDTVLVGETRNFEIGELIPFKSGILDIEHQNIRVLTHRGTFEKVLKTINKGILETWEIVNEKGQILKCTPDHRLETINGWRTVREIIERNLTCVFWNSSYLDNVKIPITIKPEKEVIKETKFRGYYVSNWGRVFSGNISGNLRVLRTRINRHERIKLKGTAGDKYYPVHRLAWEAFNGPIPEGFIIDHIDCITTHNYITNLQCITKSENTKRAYECNRVLVNNNFIPTTITPRLIAKIKALNKKLGGGYGSGRIIDDRLNKPGLNTKKVSHYVNEKSCGHIYPSKIKVVKVYQDVICDLEVENNHSYITNTHYVNHNSEMEFANGSIIASIPTTEDAGRSEGVSLLVIDEAAIMKWANTIWAAAYPTLSTGGGAIVNSTPYGVGNWYHNMWVHACSGGNQFFPIRLRWQMHPDRYRYEGDMEWYDKMRTALGPRKTAQEIDGDFLTSGASVFDLMDIRAIEEDLTEWMDRELNPDFKVLENGKLLIFKKPKTGEQYFIAGDVATGRSRDYSAFTLMNRQGEEYAVYKAKTPVDRFSDLLMKMGHDYNRAVVAPEANDIGLAVVKLMQNSGYDNLYYSTALVKQKKKKKPKEKLEPGWYTNKENRPVIIDELEEDIRNDIVTIKDPFFVQEAYTFIYDERNKPIAMGKDKKSDGDEEDEQIYTDDTILAKAICNHIRKGKYNSGIKVTPK